LAAPTATSTATSTPTITNTPTQTAISLQFLNLWISTDRFYYRGASCGPMQAQFQIGVSRPELVKSVGIFFQWKDKSSGNLSGWSEGYNMSPIGGGKYFFTLLSSVLVNTRAVEFKEAWLQYQFVANDDGGKPLLWSDVYQNITLAFCGDAPPTTK